MSIDRNVMHVDDAPWTSFMVALMWFGGVALSLTHHHAALVFRRAAPIIDKTLGCVLLAYGTHALVAML